jgi:hypothetical protein
MAERGKRLYREESHSGLVRPPAVTEQGRIAAQRSTKMPHPAKDGAFMGGGAGIRTLVGCYTETA